MEPDKQQQRQQGMERRAGGGGDAARSAEVRLPTEESPYTKYDDLEDYKRKGYGTEGHQEPKAGRGAGATDAPTLSGGAVSSDSGVPAAEDAHRHSAPK
ncbi:uncharacterized protein LOC116199783 [Punica granatum]|uniref:Uncharacterized protein n=2 Tax=Punica granatum TaxID=22663 RepID=A0A2I0KS36_PUNGR|nr:uncharacterized protein LOC116199783 [Punica granatum]PKI71285.1 hypothetical protein CRG98_008285 [Punica granatum]